MGERAGVEGSGGRLVVVEGLQSAEVPAPAVSRVTQQTLVANSVEWSLAGSHSDHGVSSSLSGGPSHLPLVQAGAVALLGPHTVRALGDGKTAHDQTVGILQNNVEGLVVGIPAVVPGLGQRHWSRVHEHGQSLGQTSGLTNCSRGRRNIFVLHGISHQNTTSQSGSPPAGQPLDKPPGEFLLLNVPSPGPATSHPAVPHVQGDDVGAGPGLGTNKPALDSLPSKQLPVALDALVDGDLVGPGIGKHEI